VRDARLRRYRRGAGQDLHIGGQHKLISHPEFQDPGKLQPLLEVVEASRQEPALFVLPAHHTSPLATIGQEHGMEELFDCSSIKCNFYFGDRTAGTVGLIGPRRMDYSDLFALVEHISGALGKTLENLPCLK